MAEPVVRDAEGRALESEAEHFRAALGTIVSASAAPYGYTLSIWSSGALLTHTHGFPQPVDVLLFISGALLGFAAVGAFARGALRSAAPISPSVGHVFAGLLHWFSVGLAAASVLALAQIPGSLAWPLGSFMATTIYLIGASTQLAIVSAWRARRSAQRRAAQQDAIQG